MIKEDSGDTTLTLAIPPETETDGEEGYDPYNTATDIQSLVNK